MRVCKKCNQEKVDEEFYTTVGEWTNKRHIRHTCKDCQNGRRRLRYGNNHDAERKVADNRRKRNIKEWNAFLTKRYGEFPKCEICGKDLKWTSLRLGEVVCLDHKSYNGKIQDVPKHWMATHALTDLTLAIFIEEDFGILCRMCNGFLRKDGRKQKVVNLIKYVGGTTP